MFLFLCTFYKKCSNQWEIVEKDYTTLDCMMGSRSLCKLTQSYKDTQMKNYDKRYKPKKPEEPKIEELETITMQCCNNIVNSTNAITTDNIQSCNQQIKSNIESWNIPADVLKGREKITTKPTTTPTTKPKKNQKKTNYISNYTYNNSSHMCIINYSIWNLFICKIIWKKKQTFF